MPWSLFNRPSIQLGALKAYIEQESDIQVDCFHPYLEVAAALDPDLYQYLSKNSWAGEALYSTLVFPERKTQAAKVFSTSCRDNREIAHQFEPIAEKLTHHLQKWVAEIPWPSYGLVGFSVCFSQLFSSLAAASLVRKHSHTPPIAFGGSSCVGSIGISLQQQFEQVDFLITGEGEQQLLKLCRQLQTGEAESALANRTKKAQHNPACSTGITDLDTLPLPDYYHYFTEVAKEFPGQPFNPILPLEFSRGCWWNKCTFCNLSLQWRGYRCKSAERLSREVTHLLQRHQCLDFTFCDNALPPREIDSFFATIRKMPADIRFFAEIRIVNDPRKLGDYRSGGLTSVQVGIESLANTLLAKMNKGVSVIENMAIMKHCAENGITLDGNLIVEFPGSSAEEARETLDNIEYAQVFHPLTAASFFLGSGSIVEKEPERFGIQSITSHTFTNLLFPPKAAKNLEMLIKDYRGDKTLQKKIWQPVRKRIKEWRDFHRNRPDPSIPALSYRDGDSFLVIRQERYQEKPLLHRLKGTSRKIYLFCTTIRSLAEIREQFPVVPEKSILNFFDDLSKKHLLYQENKQFLALAIRAK